MLSASNEIPESELLKDVIYAFQGIEGKWIKFDTGRDGSRIDSQVIFAVFCKPNCPGCTGRDGYRIDSQVIYAVVC